MTEMPTETQSLLKILKDKKHLSSDKIAKILDTTVTSISRWRNGKFTPRADQFQKLKQLAEGATSEAQTRQGGNGDVQILERRDSYGPPKNQRT